MNIRFARSSLVRVNGLLDRCKDSSRWRCVIKLPAETALGVCNQCRRFATRRPPLPPDKYEVFRALGLSTFSSDELRRAYDVLGQMSSQPRSTTKYSPEVLSITHPKPDPTGSNNNEIRYVDATGIRSLFLRIDNGNNTPAVIGEVATKFAQQFHRGHDASNIGPSDTASNDYMTSTTRSKDDGENPSNVIEYNAFTRTMHQLGTKIDPMVTTVAGSFLLTGISIGVVIPCLPLLVQHLNITPSQFGLIISSFGLAKLLANIPAAHYVESIGRKPLVVMGMGLCTLGIGGVGLALLPGFGYPWMLTCRLFTGIGVSAVTAGATMLMTDVSTTLNRTRTQAPIMACFQAGIALGPALGGVMLDHIGISGTYFTVGGFFVALMGLNQVLLHETKPRVCAPIWVDTVADSKVAVASQQQPTSSPAAGSSSVASTVASASAIKSAYDAFHTAIGTWRLLLKDAKIRDLACLNGAFMVALSGVQMTMLQLYMIGPALHLGAAEIGYTYAGLSLVSVLMSQPIAYLADRYSKHAVLLAAFCSMAVSAACIPLASSHPELLAALLPLAMGSTTLNTVPVAHMGNLAAPKYRAQALSLLRTCGDMGLMIGASAAGMIAQVSSVETAIHCNGIWLLGAAGYLASKYVLPKTS